MKLDRTFLRSKVARRIFVLFVCCALLPITALAILSFTQVTKQLNEQSYGRLRQATKAASITISERLRFLETEMKIVASSLSKGLGANTQTLIKVLGEQLEERFKALTLVTHAGRNSSLFGSIENPPAPTPAQIKHLNAGKTVIWSQHRSDLSTRILMMRSLEPHDAGAGFLLGEINPTYLHGLGDDSTLPFMTELFVLDQSNNAILSSVSVPAAFLEQMQARSSDTTWRHFEWKHEGTEYLASYRKVFLKYQFLAPDWTVVLSQAKAHVLAPMVKFKKIFSLVVLMSLWVVLLLSSIHIRRSLVPLEKLKEGTYRIARRDFDSRVTVTSGDEFEELAASFNTMSGQLGRQFKALTTIGEIDRAILSALETDKIVQTLLARMPDVLSCDAVSVGLMDSNQINTARTYVSKGNAGSEKPVEAIELTPEEVRSLFDNPQHLFIDGDGNTPHYVAPLAREGIKSFLVLPIFLNEKLSGIITIGYAGSPAHGSDEIKAASTEFGETVSQARQLADQVAVALSNAHLIEELDRLNWGTLTALARAVDAKSSWTAGHSERVTNLALEIGQVLGLAPKDLDVLRRAALLHDVGKIGIPMAILDKPKKLSEEECELMKQHTRMGGRILEPISAYADVLPIVLQHHERLNGIGYPDGLSGKAICLGARILAVADVFDAMVSDRPYRTGWDQEHVLEHIKQGAGQQFDPDVVKALLKVAGSEGRAPHESSLFRLNKLSKADDTGSGEKDYPIRPGAGHQVT